MLFLKKIVIPVKLNYFIFTEWRAILFQRFKAIVFKAQAKTRMRVADGPTIALV